MLMNSQSSTVPAFGLSLAVPFTASFSKSAPSRFNVQLGVSGATSLRVMKRLRCGDGRWARRPGRLAGTVAGPGWVTVVPTRSCMTAVSGGAGVLTGARGVVFVT